MKPVLVLVLCGIGVAAACSRTKTEGPITASDARPTTSAGHADEPEHEALPKRVHLDPIVVADARIKTAPVVREALARTIDLPGEVGSDPDKTARVAAPISGRISSVAFKEGQSVKKGDVLLRIRVPELGKAKASYAATAAKAVAARSNAERLEALAKRRLAANQEVLAAQAEADALEAETRAADAQLRALGTAPASTISGSELALRAPVSGVVVSRDAILGQPVTSDQVIATIADLAQVWFSARVFEKDLAYVAPGAAAEVELNAYPKERFGGKVEYVGKQIDPTARTVVARIELTNRKDELRLGLFGIAHVNMGESNPAPALVIARDAVTEVGGKAVVFVHEPDGDFDLHEIVLGDAALGRVQVLSGLREGEQVVVDGVFTLKSALLKGTFGEEE